MRRALICGVSGQDGAYLASFLLAREYEVWGTSRDAEMCPFTNLKRLGIRDAVKTESMSGIDFRSVLQTIKKVEPHEIYNLAGQSSVGLSFVQPVDTLESIGLASLNLLEAIRFMGTSIKLYNAGSSECFGDTGPVAAHEGTPFHPRSPYGVAKAAAYWQVANYREAYGLWACSGILFNHESPLRAPRFVTRKVVSAACRIALGSREKLALGNLAIQRDWGWAPEYVEAMWMMLQRERPEDFVIATGRALSLEDFVACAFDKVGLNWRDHVRTDPGLLRPSDLSRGLGDPGKANSVLGWRARHAGQEVVHLMVDAEMEFLKSGLGKDGAGGD